MKYTYIASIYRQNYSVCNLDLAKLLASKFNNIKYASNC